MSTYCFSDIHGCGKELIELTNKINPSPDDQLWLLGDLFDRGLNANLVWDWLQQPNRFALKGNHDLKIEKYLSNQRDWLPEHYYIALNILMDHGVSPKEVLEFIQSLPILVQINNHILVHAAVWPNDPLRQNIGINVYGNFKGYLNKTFETNDRISFPKDVTKETVNNWWDRYDNEYIIVYGHTSEKDGSVRIRKNSFGIDTSVVHGGNLTSYCLETGDIIQYKSGIDHFGKLWEQYTADPIQPYKEIVKFRESHEKTY